MIHFGVDPCQRLADGNGNPLWETAWLGDLPVAALSPAGRFYIAPDHLGSPHRIIDTGGAVVWHWNPDPFGNGDPLGTTYELRFPGQFFDQATKLHYNYFRDYDPRTGRYIESDLIGLAGGINTYAYADSNPVSGVDPLGLTDGFSQAIGGLYNKLCPPGNSGGQDECTEQWESDTKWCDNNFRGSKNIACHAWASEELARCNKGTPRQPFRY